MTWVIRDGKLTAHSKEIEGDSRRFFFLNQSLNILFALSRWAGLFNWTRRKQKLLLTSITVSNALMVKQGHKYKDELYFAISPSSPVSWWCQRHVINAAIDCCHLCPPPARRVNVPAFPCQCWIVAFGLLPQSSKPPVGLKWSSQKTRVFRLLCANQVLHRNSIESLVFLLGFKFMFVLILFLIDSPSIQCRMIVHRLLFIPKSSDVAFQNKGPPFFLIQYNFIHF